MYPSSKPRLVTLKIFMTFGAKIKVQSRRCYICLCIWFIYILVCPVPGTHATEVNWAEALWEYKRSTQAWAKRLRAGYTRASKLVPVAS